MKRVVLLLAVFALMLTLSGCWVDEPTDIAAKDFDKAQELMAEQYDLTLPDSAEYVGGFFDNAFRDPSMIVAFSVASEDVEWMLSETWEEGYDSSLPAYVEEYLGLSGFLAEKTWRYSGELYTSLWCSADENGRCVCVFSGRHPSRSAF